MHSQANGPRGLRINAICPGYVESQNVRDYFDAFPDPEAERVRAGGLHPTGPSGTTSGLDTSAAGRG